METHTIVGVFDNEARAQEAVDRLVEWGFTRDNVHLTFSDSAIAPAPASTGTSPSSETVPHASNIFHRLFGDTARHEDVSYYCEAVRRGSVVVTVTSGSDEGADSAADILNEHGAIDIEVHASYLRETGWQGSPAASTTLIAGNEPVAEEESSDGSGRRIKGGVRIYTRSSE